MTTLKNPERNLCKKLWRIPIKNNRREAVLRHQILGIKPSEKIVFSEEL